MQDDSEIMQSETTERNVFDSDEENSGGDDKEQPEPE